MQVYFFSGLGADERIFKNLDFPSTWIPINITWPQPEPNEHLSRYVERISGQVDSSGDFTFIGVSFGAVVAVELSFRIPPKHLIVISGITNRNEIPTIYRAFGFFRFEKLVPGYFFRKVSWLTYWAFGVSTPEAKALLRSTIHNTSPQFVRWALHQIFCWKNSTRPANVLHLHGANDRLFPIRKVQVDITITDGSHLMIHDKASEILPFILRELERGV